MLYSFRQDIKIPDIPTRDLSNFGHFSLLSISVSGEIFEQTTNLWKEEKGAKLKDSGRQGIPCRQLTASLKKKLVFFIFTFHQCWQFLSHTLFNHFPYYRSRKDAPSLAPMMEMPVLYDH